MAVVVVHPRGVVGVDWVGGDGGRGCTTTGVAHGLVVLVVHPETNTKQTFIIVHTLGHFQTSYFVTFVRTRFAGSAQAQVFGGSLHLLHTGTVVQFVLVHIRFKHFSSTT